MRGNRKKKSQSMDNLGCALHDGIPIEHENYVLHHVISGMGSRCDARWTDAKVIEEKMQNALVLQQFL